MKLSSIFVIIAPLLVTPEARKKGGKGRKPKVEKTPQWRRDQAEGYFATWQEKNCCTEEGCIRPERCAQIVKRWNHTWDMNMKYFAKCGYYNKEIRNGGPRPKDEPLRRRRDAEDHEADDYDAEDKDYDLYEYIIQNYEDLNEGMDTGSGDGDGQLERFRIKSEPYKAFKQLSNMAKQFMRRYLGDCNFENRPKKSQNRSTKKRKMFKKQANAVKEIEGFKRAKALRNLDRARKLEEKKERHAARELKRQ